ncbi:MAG: glycosyltransferase [Arachidicoccus sp.]|nr:glycosyltransferase [Arachidicoccus sp.]
MGNKIKYSIILPVHNGGEYVKECIQSILAQTYSDFNLHVLENKSTDGTTEWLDTIIDKRVIIISSDKLLSIEENWNRIKTIEKNEFITIIGHDDILYHNYLETMDELINKHPQASIYQTHFNFIDKNGNVIAKGKPMDEVQSGAEFLSQFLNNTIDIIGSGFMYRASDYNSLGGFPDYPNLLFADFEIYINLALKNYKATSFKECFAFRLHQSMTSRSSDAKFQEAFKRFIYFLNSVKKESTTFKEVVERYAEIYIKFYSKGLSHKLLRTPKSARKNISVKSFLNDCKNYTDLLVPNNNFNPTNNYSVKMAQIIDGNFLTRGLFLLFKKIYSKPILE